MSKYYFSGRLGRYIYCDICGQPCYANEAVRLKQETGRGGLIVCPKDADHTDPGLIPYTVTTEKPVPWTRINHTTTTNGTAVIDYETSTSLGT